MPAMPTCATTDHLTYAVPDLHGRRDLLDAALSRLAACRAGTIVFLGDYIDRGPDSAGVVARLRAGPAAGWRWVCLKGNHEAMMCAALRDASALDAWIGNGGEATLASYAARGADPRRDEPWLDALAPLHVEAHRVYVHAGTDPARSLETQSESVLLWKRYTAQDPGGHQGRHVVHGHDPDVAGPLCHTGRTALDTLAWRSGRLCVGVFDEARPGGPIDIVEIRGL